MQDPERLLSVASEAEPLERDVLTALRQVRPPAHAKAAAWSGVAAGIAAATLPASASGTAAASASSKAALGAGAKVVLGGATKVALAATLATAVLGGAYVYHERSSAPASGAAARSPRTSTLGATSPRIPVPVQPVVTAPEPVPPEPVPELERQASAPRVNAKEMSSDSLAEESALLGAARSQLRNGDAPAADATLKRLRLRFPKGVLIQERQVLAIEVLAARGQAAAAKRQARAFVQRYPDSPHSAKLRPLSIGDTAPALTPSGIAERVRGGAMSEP
jgi:hypothetical protein